MSEIQNFFDNLPTEDKQIADIFAEEVKEKAPEKEEAQEAPEKESEPRKNRRHRRLEQQLEAERTARLVAEARAQALAESRAAGSETIDERLSRLYGDENIEASRLHMELLKDFKARAKEEAIAEMEQRQLAREQEQKNFESFIDSELEAIEDEFDVDVTSDAPAARKARREFLELVQKLSPKNDKGEVTAYADFATTWEMYKSRQEKPDASRAKEIAGRTMVKSGTGQAVPQQPTPGFRGWMRDFNVSGE